MRSHERNFFGELISDFVKSNKDEIRKFVENINADVDFSVNGEHFRSKRRDEPTGNYAHKSSVEDPFGVRSGTAYKNTTTKTDGNSTSSSPENKSIFSADEFDWNPGKTYYIETNQPFIVTGAVQYDTKLGCTKVFDVQDQTLYEMQSFDRSAITFARIATHNEKLRAFAPPLSFDEALHIMEAKTKNTDLELAWLAIKKELFTQKFSEFQRKNSGSQVSFTTTSSNSQENTPRENTKFDSKDNSTANNEEKPFIREISIDNASESSQSSFE